MFGRDSVSSGRRHVSKTAAKKGELPASRMLTGAALIGLTRLHPCVARRGEPQAFHSGGGLSVEKVQHLDTWTLVDAAAEGGIVDGE